MAIDTRVVVPVVYLVVLVVAMVLPVIRFRMREQTSALAIFKGGKDDITKLADSWFSVGLVIWTVIVFCHSFLDPRALSPLDVPLGVHSFGWFVVGASLLLTMTAQAQMGSSFRIGIDTDPTALVTVGLFKVIRNPIFSGLFGMLLGLTLVIPSPWTLGALALMLGVFQLHSRLEEAHLVRMHGTSYLAYASRVGRFVPGVGLLALP